MNKEIIKNELTFKAVRSSGAGGQHINKVSSKIELSFNISNSKGLSEQEKKQLIKHSKIKLTKENILILTCQESRSQHKNKDIVIHRFFELITKKLIKRKKRKPTKPTKISKIKRMLNKKRLSEKKENRKKIDI